MSTFSKKSLAFCRAVFTPCALAALFGLLVHAQKNEPADFILLNARIYTLDAHHPWAEALAVKGEKIVGVGTAQEVARSRGDGTRVADASGRLVLPSFTDCHIHFLEGSLSLNRVDLSGAGSVPEIQKRLRKYAVAHPGPGWLLGQGWSYSDFGSATLPDRKYIDEVLPDRPVFLDAFDGHTSWANSRALQLAGITRDTPDPPNGKIVRDPATGEPTGTLKESAGALVQRLIPQPTKEEKLAALVRGMAEANRAGLVRVDSAGGDFEELALFDQLRQNGQLTIRLYAAKVIEPPELESQTLKTLQEIRARYHDDWLDAGAAKFFLDGVIESHTAAMLAPYSDDPAQSGALNWPPEKYVVAVEELDRRGFQIFTHAIGDRAVRLALDAYERAEQKNPQAPHRNKIEHIETISPEDVPRFGRLGITASMQPFHASPDDDTLNVWARNAGPERSTRAFAWHDIAAAGGRLAFGSDWPVVTLDPWIGLQTAVTRQTLEGKPEGGWIPGERITLQQAIAAYTLDAAYASRREQTEGSLEPRKFADFIVVSQDIFKIQPREISKTRVLLTVAGGKAVYHSPEWNDANSLTARTPAK